MKKIIIYIATTLFVCTASVSAQNRTYMPGLENNSEYIGLFEKETELKNREDSLTAVITRLRAEFRTGGDEGGRQKYADEILRIESTLFDIKNETGIVAGRISAIEQDFLLSAYSEGGVPEADIPLIGKGSGGRYDRYADLTKNDIFSELLKPEDHAALIRAQSREKTVYDLAAQFMENYRRFEEIKTLYAKATDAPAADTIYNRYSALKNVNQAISDSLQTLWNSIFDDKYYAYSYALDRSDERTLLSRLETQTREATEKITSRRGETESDEIYSYFERKKLLFNFESTLAGLWQMQKAGDSLFTAERNFNRFVADIPRIEIEEKLFLDFAPIEVATGKYTARNPIPEAIVYPKGTIYRILLGSYTRLQQVGIFRNVSPLGYVKDADGKFNYYAGGFATVAEALEALDKVRKLGFRAPKIAKWQNGQYSVLDENALDSSAGYRIEITGVSALPSGVTRIVGIQAQGKDIIRVGSDFIIGPFDSRLKAEELAEQIAREFPDLEVAVGEVPTEN